MFLMTAKEIINSISRLKFQTKLDIWRSRDLTLFGNVLISKILGISSLVYSMSNIDVPKEVIPDVQRRLFKFLWNNKQDKIKRTSLYQDFEKGGLRMPDIETINKALKLAWIPRLLRTGGQFQNIYSRNMVVSVSFCCVIIK